MMPRRMNMSLRPIQRIKHIVDSQATVAAGVQLNTTIAVANDNPVLANTTEVLTGSKINGFFIRMEVASNDDAVVGAVPNAYMFLWKNTAGDLTPPAPNGTGGNDLKRLIIHQEMTMIENIKGGNARTLFKGVIVIPKGMRRMGANDVWRIEFRSVQIDTAVCIQAIYKEFR